MGHPEAPVETPKKHKGGRPKKIRPVADVTLAEDAVAAAPLTEASALHEFSTDGDLVDIWERRMLHPGLKPATPIRLKTVGMHLRWINLANNGRYQRARYEEGWVPVQRDQLKDEREIYGVSFTTEGWVCRGEKQQEMLMLIPEAVYKKIRTAKINEVERSNRKIKDNMQSAGAKHFGDKYNSNRGDQIADTFSGFKGEIKFGSENVEPDGEDLARARAGVGD
jgi:hypothetical protein